MTTESSAVETKPTGQPAGEQQTGASQAASPTAEHDASAGSSPATSGPAESQDAGAQKPKSALDAALKALEKSKPAEAAKPKDGEESPASEQGKTPEGAETGKPAEKDGEKGKGAHKDAASRLNELLEERKQYLPKAQQYEQLTAWVRESGLNEKEFVNTLVVARLAKQDPVAALKMLRPVVAELEKQAGEVLPDDLREKMERGLIDEDTALEVSRSRVRASHSERRAAEALQREQDGEQTRKEAAQIHAIASEATTWEKSWAASDPDYPKLKGLVKTRVQALIIEEGAPASPEQARAQCQKALELVKEDLAGVLPQGKPMRVVTGGTNGTATARPNNALEAARLAAQGVKVAY